MCVVPISFLLSIPVASSFRQRNTEACIIIAVFYQLRPYPNPGQIVALHHRILHYCLTSMLVISNFVSVSPSELLLIFVMILQTRILTHHHCFEVSTGYLNSYQLRVPQLNDHLLYSSLHQPYFSFNRWVIYKKTYIVYQIEKPPRLVFNSFAHLFHCFMYLSRVLQAIISSTAISDAKSQYSLFTFTHIVFFENAVKKNMHIIMCERRKAALHSSKYLIATIAQRCSIYHENTLLITQFLFE